MTGLVKPGSPAGPPSFGEPAARHFALSAAEAKLNTRSSFTIVRVLVAPIQVSSVAAYDATKSGSCLPAVKAGAKSRCLTYQ